MKNKKVVLAVGLISILLIICSYYLEFYYIKRSINGNNYEEIKKSIFYLHKEHMNVEKEIKIIDEFNYDYKKVILFKNDNLTGIAKFDKDSKGKYKIDFVETLDDNNKRKVSKVS